MEEVRADHAAYLYLNFKIPAILIGREIFATVYESTVTMSTTRTEEAAVESTPVVEKNVKRRWVSYIWDTFDKSPEERRLLFKLDSAILTFASLGMCVLISLSHPHTNENSLG